MPAFRGKAVRGVRRKVRAGATSVYRQGLVKTILRELVDRID